MTKTICLAGGCFWGMEKLLAALPGVTALTVGYANGKSHELASYQAVCSGTTGFREAVRLDYDPAILPLERVLFCFFAVVDTEAFHRQGPDIGSQYQSGVYWSDEESEEIVRHVAAVEAAGVKSFCVELESLRCFYPAEGYHQSYLEKNPGGYCHISPLRMSALKGYPFSKETYTRPAAMLLRDYREHSGL